MRLLTRALLVTAVLFAAGSAAAQDLAVAAASDLQTVMPAIAERYTRQTGTHVRVVYGSSGNFFTQIQNGAPFDVFFSADVGYPARLAEARLAVAGSLYKYAVGRLVVWARRDAGLDVSGGLALLADPRVARVAIANPDHAPYGRAAVAALRQAGLYDRVKPKLVLGENISQAAQFVQTGNAQAGILALSIARAPAAQAMGVYAAIPADAHPPIEQAAVVLTRSANPGAAQAFLDFVKGPAIVALLEENGFASGDR
jgi:molybdate transport system substrate-binding protein